MQISIKRLGLLVVALALPSGAVAAADVTPASPVDQVYFDATISKGGHPVTRPVALVRVGSTAQFSLGTKSATGQRLGLRYVVPPPGETVSPITVSGLLDGREVVTAPIDLLAAEGSVVTLEGGGYTWRVQASPKLR